MLEKVFSPHLANLQSSLDRTSQRQSVLTLNLSNLNTPGYKRQDVDFGITLQQEMRRLGSDEGEVRTDEAPIRLDGSSVDLEREVFAMAETDLRFRTLSDMTAGYFSGLKNVIREGK
jgi:flagellar basal-body rod protein FlgB